MSFVGGEGDIIFNIYYKGKFKTDDGVTVYEGGETHILEAPVLELFNCLGSELKLSLYHQRIWFKLPYEELSELRFLCRDGESFNRMANSANWTRCVEIYMEEDDVEEEAVETEVNNDVEDEAERENHTETRNTNEKCDAEARVEEIVAECVVDDDGDDLHYRNTPPQSDSEEERRFKYERWRRGSGELKIKQVFESVKEFREAVLEYALLGGWNIQFNRWGRIKSEAVCGLRKGENPCPWRIYCSYEHSTGEWMVKTFQEEHTCFKNGQCKILSETIIAQLFIKDIRKDPLYKPKVMQDQIQERYNIITKYDKCRKARTKALAMIQAEYDEEYRRMKDYEAEILDSNPGSSTDLVTVDGDAGLRVFDRFYVCYAGLRRVWLRYCRPIIDIDGCFLKSDTKGQLLTAVGRDGNNQIYPVAWAVVNTENTDTWSWFIGKLKTDLKFGDGAGYTLVSDRQKGLLKAVDQELPKIEHRMCARHIYGNIKKNYPRKAELKNLFWAIVESPNVPEYESNLAKLKEYDIGVYEALMARNPRTCSRAYFKTTSKCEDALNNFSESYNSVIEKARALPLVQMLETMRRQTMVRIDTRKKKAMQHRAKFTPKVSKTIELEEKQRKWCISYPGPNGLFEVVEHGTAYRVNMRAHTCSCRRWDLTGIPCRHALRVGADKKTYKTEDMVSDCYLTTKWQDQFSESIKPLNGMQFWSTTNDSTIEVPARDVNKGRRKKPEQRKKGVNESPTKGKKVTGHCRVMHCHRCGIEGHNISRCKNVGVPKKPPPPKKRKRSTACDEVTLGIGEGPTQTQE